MKQIYFIIFAFSAVFSFGQVKLVAEVEEKEYRVNQKFTVTFMLVISGENMVQQTSLKLPDFSKFQVIASGSEQNTLLLDRGAVNQTIYQWVLAPKIAGELKIGSALVTVNGKIYKTEPVEIMVLEAEKTEIADSSFKNRNDLHINLEIEDQEIYKNQPTVAVLRAYSRNLNNFRKISNIKFPEQEHITFASISTADTDIEPAQNNISSKILGIFLIYPAKSGRLELKPVTATFGSKAVKLLSNKVNLKVKALPANSPKNYKNAVGDFKMDFNFDAAQTVEVNKPIHLLLKISGEGNMENLNLPKIIDSKRFQIFPPKIIKNITNAESGMKGNITADYVVIPKTAGFLEVATEGFSFFHPDTGQYTDLGEKTLSLNVYSTEEMLAQRTPLERVNEYTNNVLQTVDSPVLQTKKLQVERKDEVDWMTSFINIILFLIVSSILLLVGFFRRRRKSAITAAAENEQISIKSREIVNEVDLQNIFGYMTRMVREKDYRAFFKSLAELDERVRSHYKAYYETSFLSGLEWEKGPRVAEEYRILSQKVQIEKYAPVANEEQTRDLLPLVIKLYSKIA